MDKKKIDIIVPVKNEAGNLLELTKRLDQSLTSHHIDYGLIFIDDHSTDSSLQILEELSKKYPIKVFIKQGKPGKAYSILEGASYSDSENLGMIDGDLQYEPEAIPEMYQKLDSSGVVIGKRKFKTKSKIRKLASKTFKFIFGKALFGFNFDVQSGLKLFKKEIITKIDPSEVSPWTIDLPLLHTAVQMGYTIDEVEVGFHSRVNGQTKINLIQSSFELAAKSVELRFAHKKVYQLEPKSSDTMLGAGIAYNKKRFITHTILHQSSSALKTLTTWQKIGLGAVIESLVIGLILNPLLTIQVVVAALSAIYFIDVIFNFFLIFKSLHFPPEIDVSNKEINEIKDKDLPVYSILCPLYREAQVLPNFIESISRLNWPKDKLDVILLLEEDDTQTLDAVKSLELPGFIRTLIVPNSSPKTKPKACNYGLNFATGEYIVIFDAEDQPEPDQLKKAYLGFAKAGKKVVCLQAKLNYHNPHQNLLTRLFTAEYSLWFEVILTGLQSIETSIPLGGTSNHFRTADLLALEGWDPFNVTEDCDLGIRIFQRGYKTAIIDSVTLEEANSKFGNWLRQRSRWIKGYMQTYLVHMRNPIQLVKNQGWHALVFQLTLGGKIAFIFINPFLWLMTVSYFVLYSLVGPTIESFYPATVFYMAVTSLVFGNFLFLYYYMIGLAKKEQWNLIKFVFLVPFYWLMVSIAGTIALYQLIFKPHYWEKTVHGFYLKKKEETIAEAVIEAEEIATGFTFPQILRKRWGSVIANKKVYFGGVLLVCSSIIGNFLNFAYNAYLGRVLGFKDFALIGLVGGLLSFSSILFGAFTTTANFRSGFLIGKYGDNAGYSFWRYVRQKAILFSLVITIVWIASTPLLVQYFGVSNIYLFLLFGLVLIVGLANGADRGFLSARLMFGSLAAINLFDPIIKLAVAIILVFLGLQIWTFASVPIAILGTFIIGWLLVVRQTHLGEHQAPDFEIKKFPKKFFAASLLTGFSSIAFLTVDILLANHFLTQTEAGKYTLLSLVGKMVYFLGGLTTPFIVPLISRKEGANKNSLKTFYILLFLTALLSLVGFLAFGLLGEITIPILYGTKALAIVPYLTFFTLGMAFYTVSKVFINYYLVKRIYSFTVVTSLLVLLQFAFIYSYHKDTEAIALVMSFIWGLHLFITILLHVIVRYVKIFEDNLTDLFGLFASLRSPKPKSNENLKILIFNWRDTKHKWAGGAEVYIHELAKRWVKEGSSVTIFSGNDSKSSRNETIDGIQIYRRGGFYMVYLWAFLYYMFKFRGKFDVIIDSENGIPFFTPLFAREKTFLLIHHVHQEVFMTDLRFPLAQIGKFLEGVVMPLVYRNSKVITVSQSSKQAILELGFGKRSEVSIVSPGVDLEKFQANLSKTRTPSLLYLGRLKPYKSVDRLIRIMKKVKREIPQVTLTIAGEGESREYLESLTKRLGLRNVVKFLGGVSEKAKVELFAKSWALVQPSRKEGWGITIIEANAAGTTVIASDVPGLRDSIQNPHTGLLVTWDNQEKWVDAITKVLKDKQFRTYLENNSKQWVAEFSWDKSSNKLIKLLQD